MPRMNSEPMHGPSRPFSVGAESDSAANPAIAALLVIGLVATALIGAPLQFVRPETIKATAASVFIAAALALWAWRLEKSSPVRWSAFLFAPFGLALFGALSTAWSPATTALTDAGRWLMLGILVFLGLNALGRESFPGIARAAHWCILILSALALAEFWFNFSWFPTEAPPGANFGNRNFFAEALVVALPYSIWMLVRPNTPNGAAFSGLGFGVIVVALMSTGTRAALVAALAVLVLFVPVYIASAARSPSRARPMALLAAIGPALFVILALSWLPTSNPVIMKEARGSTPMDRTVNRLRSLASQDTYADESSFGLRRAAWEVGGKMIADHPIRGVGAGGWNSVGALYSGETADVETVWLAHNEPLQLVAEYGLAGWAALAALAWLLIGVCVGIGKDLREGARPGDALQDTVVVLSIGAFAIVSLSGLPLHASTTCYLLALALGFLLANRPYGKMFTAAANSAAPLLAGRIAAVVVLASTLVICVQGMRSDYLVQHGGGMLLGLLNDRSLPKDVVAQRKDQALADLRRGFAIHPEHGLETPMLATAMMQLSDPASVIWLSSIALETRPHVAALKCNMARANSELGKFDAALQILQDLEKTRPGANCLPIARLDYAYKKGDFAHALATGQKFLSAVSSQTKPENVRFVVDTTYRAAIRVPDLDAAIVLLRLRADRWPELRAMSWMLMGQLHASRSPGQVVPAAADAFKQALAFANPQERQQVWERVPANYRPLMN